MVLTLLFVSESRQLQCKPRQCADLQCYGYKAETQSGRVYANDAIDVGCDIKTDGGGWTVFLRRIDNNIRLRGKTVTDWRNLVGDLSGDFWMGFSNIRKLTSSRQNRHFRFDMRAAAKSPAHAVYENVRFDGAQFQMLYDKFADTLSNTGNDLCNGCLFTTISGTANVCARYFYSSGWYKADIINRKCIGTSFFGSSSGTSPRSGIRWVPYDEHLTYIDFKFRPINFLKSGYWCNNPCRNNGTCVYASGLSTCHCAYGFTGRLCEGTSTATTPDTTPTNSPSGVADTNSTADGNSTIPATSPLSHKSPKHFTHIVNCPCINGGWCKLNNRNATVCVCPQNFNGSHCEQDWRDSHDKSVFVLYISVIGFLMVAILMLAVAAIVHLRARSLQRNMAMADEKTWLQLDQPKPRVNEYADRYGNRLETKRTRLKPDKLCDTPMSGKESTFGQGVVSLFFDFVQTTFAAAANVAPDNRIVKTKHSSKDVRRTKNKHPTKDIPTNTLSRKSSKHREHGKKKS
ncbi:hypothetical protein LSAT2_025379 [Lamellibrachia satsuma]|nr:hypothetical protein LSAT2_025379 [Lamellibrachia satsuma]